MTSRKQFRMLLWLLDHPASTIIDVVRGADGYADAGASGKLHGHSASYARFHRLRRRGLIDRGVTDAGRWQVTPRGRALLSAPAVSE